MPLFDFDQLIDRRPTASLKWGRYHDQDILPLWVADMDFPSPPAVQEALHQRIDHGVFGYTCTPSSLNRLLQQHLDDQYGWSVDEDWMEWLPGLVCGLNLSIRACVPEGGSYMTPVPVYPPFTGAARLCERGLITPRFEFHAGQWQLDFEALAEEVTPDTRLFLLCNPHNPLGKVWRREELEALDRFCQKHALIVCSDEIHCELLLDETLEHIPYATISDYAREHSITLMAPSKTYNIAGLACSLAVIPNKQLRRQFQRTRRGIVPEVNLLGLTAAEAAWRDGEPWRQALLEYLRGNRDYLLKALKTLPGIHGYPIEATYLAWLNIGALNLSNPAYFFESAGLGLSPGADFGDRQHMRLNFGCPRSMLEQAVERMQRALAELPVA